MELTLLLRGLTSLPCQRVQKQGLRTNPARLGPASVEDDEVPLLTPSPLSFLRLFCPFLPLSFFHISFLPFILPLFFPLCTSSSS